MFRHYITIALRNIRKYALQNAVCCIGMAAGLVCLSFSALWIHFEESFDNFHKDSDRIFTLLEHSPYSSNTSIEKFSPELLSPLLEFSQVESYTKWNYRNHGEVKELIADTTFFSFFDFSLLQGNRLFRQDTNYVALSQDYSKRLFPDGNAIGKECYGKTVCAVIAPFQGPSCLSFDILCMHIYPDITPGVIAVMPDQDENAPFAIPMAPVVYSHEDRYPNGFFKIHKGTDTKWLSDSLSKVIDGNRYYLDAPKYELLPISDVHKQEAAGQMYIGYKHARLFAWASLLLTLCSLVNFLLFSLNRTRNREHEMALRVVHGANGSSILKMMATESGIILGIASLLGYLAIILLKDRFRDMADADMTGGYVLWGGLSVIIIAFAVSVFISIISVGIVRNRTIQSSIIRKTGKRFRNISIGIQLFVSILFSFVIICMLHQFRFLRNNNWGIRINDMAVLTITNPDHKDMNGLQGRMSYSPIDERMPDIESPSAFINRIDGQFGITSQLNSLPFVEGVYTDMGGFDYIYESVDMIWKHRGTWINGDDNIRTNIAGIIDTSLLKLFSLNVLDGAIPTDRPLRDNELVITRNLQRELGLGDISQGPTLTIRRGYRTPSRFEWVDGQPTITGGEYAEVTNIFQVVAVVSDLYLTDFNKEPESYILCAPNNRKLLGQMGGQWSETHVSITYQPGKRKELSNRINEIMELTGLSYELNYSEDYFYEKLTKDRHLSLIIEILGILCMLISLAGIYSTVALTCQEKKREIALRKVHGAKVRDILSIFARDYGIILALASALAFIIGYMVIDRWQQHFLCKADNSWWIYACVFAFTATVIIATVLNRVLTTARQNPADVIKSE